MTRRYIVTGDRHWHCTDVAERVLKAIRARHGDDFVIVHGDARGVDRAFRETCERLGIPHEPYPADWDRFGKGAGPRRNAAMIAAGADYAIAVHRDIRSSKGTRDCVKRCLAAGITVYLFDGINPTQRLTEV